MKKISYLMIFLTFSVLFVQANTQSVIWSETFEDDWSANWHVESGTWEVGEPTSGPNAAYTGDKCAATVLGGNYSNNVETRLIRFTSFTVPSSSENPRLRFWHWFNFIYADYGKVQVRIQGNTDWEDVSPSYSNSSSDAWTYAFIDLSAYEDQVIQIAFYLNSDNAFNNPGWYIDDVIIETGPYTFTNPETFESGIGNWSSERGTWEVGTPTSGPESANNGVNCAATVLEGNYSHNLSTRLISPPIAIPSANDFPRLRFWHWFNFIYADYGKVQVRIHGITDWEDVSPSYSNSSSDVWTYAFIDLSAYADQVIQIAFYLNSDNAFNNPGWYIDDVIIESNLSLSNEMYILIYNFETPPQSGDANIDLVNHTIDIEVEYGTDLTSLVAEFTLSDGATAKLGDDVQESGVTSNDFTSPITYTVTAEDGTTVQDWVVTVTVVPNTETEITDFGFGIPPQTSTATIDPTAHTIDIEVEYGTDLTSLVAEFSLSDSATVKIEDVVQESGVTSNDFTNPVIYTVTAEDGTTVQDWVVTVTVAPNTETEIMEFSFGIPPQIGEAVIDPDSGTIGIEVESETDLTTLIATFTLSEGATVKIGEVVQESGITPNDFSSMVIYTVIAEDGTTVQEWNVLVDRVTGADNVFLRKLKIYPNPFSESTTIEFSNPKHSNHQLILYNILGEKVLELNNVTSDKIILKRGSLITGIYMILLKGENEIYSQLISIKE